MDAAAGIAAKGSTVYLLSCRYAADYDFGTTTAEAIPYPVHQRLIARIYAQLSAHGHRVHVTVFASPPGLRTVAGRTDGHP